MKEKMARGPGPLLAPYPQPHVLKKLGRNYEIE